MGTRLVSLDYADLYRVKWILGGLLGILSLWNVFALDLGLHWMVQGATLLMIAAVLWPPLAGALPKWFWRIQTPLIVIFVVSDFILAGGDLIPPLIRMVILLTLLRTLQPRTRREDLQLVVLTLLLVVVTGVLSLELSFAAQVMVYTPMVMLYLFVITLAESFGEEEEVPDDPWKGFRWQGFLLKIRGLFDGRLMVFSGLLFIGMVASTTLLFVALPRFELGQALPFLRMQARSTLSGFSEDIRYGDIVSIINDDSLAFRADVGSVSPPVAPYWRMMVLDEYRGDGFGVSDSLRAGGRRESSSMTMAPAALRHQGAGDAWTVYFEGGISRYLPLPGAFNVMRFQNRQVVSVSDQAGSIMLEDASANVFFYQMTSVDPRPRPFVLKSDAVLVDESRTPILRLESGGTGSTYPETTRVVPGDPATQQSLERALRDIAAGTRELLPVDVFIERAVHYLQRNRGYSLQTRVPQGEGDLLTRWMDSTEPGHCELFAGAFTLLARQAGHPARVVVGFHGGDWNGYENYFMVRNRHAHAWTEIFDPERGWVQVDPTPGSGRQGQGASDGSGDRANAGIDRTWSAYMDSLRILWYRRVVSFDREQQHELVSGLGGHLRHLTGSAIAFLQGSLERLRAWFAEPWDREHITFLLRNLLVAIGVWVALRILWRFLSSGRYRFLSGTSRTRTEAGRWLRRLQEASAAHPAADQPEVQTIRKDLLCLRYGDPAAWPPAGPIFKRVRTHLRALRKLK